jgi:hypothetical protein
VAARTQRVDDVADWRSGTLRLARVCKGVAAPPGRATSTCSRLLYDTLGVVYDWLGFDIVDDPVFRDLVIARLVEPTSKADALRGCSRIWALRRCPTRPFSVTSRGSTPGTTGMRSRPSASPMPRTGAG